MPCHSIEYPKQTEIEKELINIFYIQDELSGQLTNYSFGHPRTNDFELTQKTLNTQSIALCEKIQNVKEIYKLSDRLQDWWTSHQLQDYINLHKAIQNSKDPNQFISNLNNYDKEIVQLANLSKSLLIKKVNSTKWKHKELETEENLNRLEFIYGIQFLNTLNLLYNLINVDNEVNKKFDSFKTNEFIFTELEAFFESKLDVNLKDTLLDKEYVLLKNAVELNNHHSKLQLKHIGIMLSSTLQQLNKEPITKSLIIQLLEILEKIAQKITIHNTIYNK